MSLSLETENCDIPDRIMDVAVVERNNDEIEHPTFSVNNPKGMLRFLHSGKEPLLSLSITLTNYQANAVSHV